MVQLLTPSRTRRTRKPAAQPVVLDTRVVTGSGGGPDKTILNSPRFLEPLGYKMLCGYLAPPNDPGYSDIELKAAKYQAPLLTIPDRGPWDWRIVSQLVKICKEHQVDIWHGHDYKTNALGLMLQHFWPMRLVTTVHGWVHHTTRTPLYYRIDQLCLPWYEKVICVSPDLYHQCRKNGVKAHQCELLENGIDLAEYQRQRSVSEAKAELKLPGEQLLIGAVGRLAPEKGFDVLIQSIAELRKLGFPVRLVIVGEGHDRSRLEALRQQLGLQDCVDLPGWQSDVRKYFEAMDVFALSSFREGLPNVLLEAMALQVPCVATRIAGIPRLIQNQENGLLIEAHDGAALTTALRQLLEKPGIRGLYAANARKTIEERYSFQTRMERLTTIYDNLWE